MQRGFKGKAGGGGGQEGIITEKPGNLEAEMNVEQEVLKEQQQGVYEPKARESRPPALRDGADGAVSNSEADETEEDGSRRARELGSTLDVAEAREGDSTRQVEVLRSPMEQLALAPPRIPSVALPVGSEDIPAGHDSSESSGLPSESNAPVLDDLPPPPPLDLTAPSPGKKRPKKARLWKKNGGRKKSEKDPEELSAETLQSRDACTQTDQHELERNAHEADLGGRNFSDMPQLMPAEGHETVLNINSEGQPLHDRDALSAAGLEGTLVVEDVRHAAEPSSFASLKALRSFGRWADVSEDAHTSRANDMEPDESLTSGDISRAEVGSDLKEEQALGGKIQPAIEGSKTRDPMGSDHKEQQLGGKIQPAIEGSKTPDPMGSDHKEQQLGGKIQPAVEGSKAQDPRADNWNSRKEQDLRGKSQLASSQASRELNWRQRPAESRPSDGTPTSAGKLGPDGDSKKDEPHDFRTGRTQYGAEPQATHKNWIPRKGLQRIEGEGRAEQNKARGKAKQGREAGPQAQSNKDSARQKFEADLKIKQEELLQKSKQSLKAEFQKAKRIEQARKGREELEMELNKNLVCEEGELFYLNA